MYDYKRMQKLAGIINESSGDATHSSSGFIYGNYNTSIIFKNELEEIQKDYPELKFYVEFDDSPVRRDKDIIKYSYSFPINNDNEPLESILEDIIKHFESPQYQNESTIVTKNTDSTQISDIAKREKTDSQTVQSAVNQAKQTGKPININELSNKKMKKSEFKKFLKEEITGALQTSGTMNEMAKIVGDVKTAVEKVIDDNPDLEGAELKKAIMKDPNVIAALGEEDLYHNQLNKFIGLHRGTREVGQRGRKPDPNKLASAPKSPKEKTGPSREELIHSLEKETTLDREDSKWANKLDKLSTSALKDMYKKYFSDEEDNSVDVGVEATNVAPTSVPVNEMAKITGDLESAIRKVVNDNPDKEGLALKKAIKGDGAVKAALGGDTLYDNQLNKFIALVKGDRKIGQRGRKPGTANSETSTTKPSLTDLVDGDDEEVEDTYNKPDTDFDDDFDDDNANPEIEDTSSIDNERVAGLKDQATKKFWKSFVIKMKEKGYISADNKVVNKDKLDKAKSQAQKALNQQLSGIK